MKYAINTTAITLFIKGRSIRVEKTDRKYPKVLEAFNLPLDEQEQFVEGIINETYSVENVVEKTEGFEFREGEIFYKNEKLPSAFSQKVKSIVRDGLPLDNFEKFWSNLEQNPSAQSVEELTQFLEYKELPITEDGCFLAYKGVQDDYYSLHGNLETKVLQGIVNERGQIYNGIGEVVEVRRRDVDDDRNKHCSNGLHCGSLEYARGFAPRLILVKVNPADVVSVPTDYSCQKCRVSKYEVVSDFVEEITASVVKENGDNDVVPDVQKERQEFIDRIARYLSNKREQGFDQVTLRQIQNSLSPEWATKQEVIDALQALGEYYHVEDGVTYIDLI
jgi:hypothetical protein